MIYGIWTFCAALLAFIISAVTGKFLIPYLRKLHFGKQFLRKVLSGTRVNRELPQWAV